MRLKFTNHNDSSKNYDQSTLSIQQSIVNKISKLSKISSVSFDDLVLMSNIEINKK